MTVNAVRPTDPTPYEYRLGLVTAILQEHAGLDADGASGVAASVLHAIDTIPERVR